MKNKRGKKGVMQLPFGMIFSIILIVVFIAVAIYAISAFLGWKKCAEIGMFKEDLQEEIDRAWNSEQSSKVFDRSLPSDVKEVCFIELETGKGEKYEELKQYGYVKANVFFWPLEKACKGLEAFEIKHLDIKKITEKENPYCVNVVKGRIEVKIEKGFYDAIVKVSEISSKGGSNGAEFCGSSTLYSCSSNSDCKAGGCSNQVCEGKGEGTITTCEFKDCYNAEKYSLECKCVNGKCKWA